MGIRRSAQRLVVMRGTIFEDDGLRFKAQDDEICDLLSDAAIFENIGQFAAEDYSCCA